MATWTASDDWGGYVAEIGPYVGPWPPAPPIPANLPADTILNEVDYVVTTSPLADVLTFSMADGVDVWRWWNTSTTTQAVSGIGRPLVTGATLYVVAYLPGYTYPGSGAPPMDAASLVPPLYAAGAAGTDVPDPASGAWSSPQPGQVERATAFGTLYGGGYLALDIAAGWVDVQAESDVALGDLRAWPVSSAWSGPGTGAPSASMFFTGIHDTDGGGANRTQAIASLVQAADWYETTAPGLVQPDLLSGLIEGLDYTAPPAGTTLPPDSAGAAYFTGPLTFDGWDDDPAASLSIRIGDGLHVSPVPPTPFGTARVAIIDKADVIAGPPYLYTDGDTATEQTKTTTGTDHYTFTAPLSGVSGESFGLIVLSRFMDSDGSPLNDFTGAGIGDWQVAARLESINPVARWQQPDWQYWTLGVKWHTVCGHWAELDGVPLRILTPMPGGNVWIDVVDGPA